jgi:hypothetical protein
LRSGFNPTLIGVALCIGLSLPVWSEIAPKPMRSQARHFLQRCRLLEQIDCAWDDRQMLFSRECFIGLPDRRFRVERRQPELLRIGSEVLSVVVRFILRPADFI